MHEKDIPDALEIGGRRYSHSRHGDLSVVVDDDGAALTVRTPDGGSRLIRSDDVVRLLASGVARPVHVPEAGFATNRPIRSLRRFDAAPRNRSPRPLEDVVRSFSSPSRAPVPDSRADEALTWAAFVHLTTDTVDVMDAYALYLDALLGLHGGGRVPARLVRPTSALRRRISQVRLVLEGQGATSH